jgi:RNA 3'-terminal phosphate cyclase (ATP)
MVEIDGSLGEGGGQVIRTALSLSALLGTPFRIRNIRQNRPKPGLRAQHLAAVRAMKEVCRAHAEGDRIGSKALLFWPNRAAGGVCRFDIGTAGATPLVLQALIPPLVYADRESRIVLTGGTHVPVSPPFHFLEHVFLPALKEMGGEIEASARVYGFYPKGGGEIDATIRPIGSTLLPLEDREKKVVWGVTGVSAVANLPLSIAERQKQAALLALRRLPIRVGIETTTVHSPGQGTFFFLKTEGAPCSAGFSSIGVRGKRAEQVGTEAALALLDYYNGEGCIDPHLADQLVLYQALAEGRSFFTTTTVTQHLLTNLAVVKQFVNMEYRVEGGPGTPGRVYIHGIGLHPGGRPLA